MSKSRPFAYNISGVTFSGTEQIGDLAVGIPTDGFGSTGLNWYNGPDEELGYVICRPTENPSGMGFIRSELTDDSFIEFVNTFFGQNFASASVAKSWLSGSGYWTSYPDEIISFTVGLSRVDLNEFVVGQGAEFSETSEFGYKIGSPTNNLLGYYQFSISDDDTDILNAFDAASMSTSSGAGYIWNVSWGPGSTASTLAKVGYDSANKVIRMITLDTADTDYQINGNYYGTTLPGTFNLPVTFTNYEPTTNKDGWC